MSKYFKVTKSLTCVTESKEIEFFGCDAETTGETSSCYFVRFYAGLPFMVGKNKFLDSTVPAKGLTNIENMLVADITLWLGEAKIKTYRGVLNPHDHDYHSVRANVSTWFKLEYGEHYDRVTHEPVEEIKKSNNKTTMAKKEVIEEAEVIEEITESLSVVEKIATSLPAIPDSFVIDGNEYSVAVVKEMEKEANKLLAKATPETYNSKAIWEEVSTLKNKLVKMRTTPDNKRKELSKPFQDFVKEIKAKTDAVGDAAKAVQDKLDAALLAKEQHEAELARIEAEKIAKRTKQREEDLRALGGIYDVDNGSFSFPYAAGTVIGQLQLNEYDDAEWSNEYNLIKKAWDEEQERIAKEEAEKNAQLKAAEEALKKIEEKKISLRGKELRLEGFEFDEGLQSWKKNGVVIHVLGVAGYSDEDWDATIEEANNPLQASTEPVAPVSPVTPTEPSSEQKEAPQPPNFDAIGAALGSVNANVEPQEEEATPQLPEGVIMKHLAFTNEQPYIDVTLKNTFLRIYPDEKDFEANQKVSPDKIKTVIRKEEMGLSFAIISL